MQPYQYQDKKNKVLLLDMDHTIIDTKKYHNDGEIGKNIFPNVIEFMKDMKQKGYKIGIVTHSMGNDGDRATPSSLLEKVTNYLQEQGVKIDATSEPFHVFQRNIPELLNYLDKLPKHHPSKKFLDKMDSMDLFQFRYQVLLPLMGKGSRTGLTPMWDNIRHDLGVDDYSPVDLIMVGDSKSDVTFAVDLSTKYKNIDAKAIFLTHKLLKHYTKINPQMPIEAAMNDDPASEAPLINDLTIKKWLAVDRDANGQAYINPITDQFNKSGKTFLLHDWEQINHLIRDIDPTIQTPYAQQQHLRAHTLNHKFLPNEAAMEPDSNQKASFVQRYTSGQKPAEYSYVNALYDAKTHPTSSLERGI